METKGVIMQELERIEQSIERQRETFIRRNKPYQESRLFNITVGKMFGLLELCNELGIETNRFKWVYQFGI